MHSFSVLTIDRSIMYSFIFAILSSINYVLFQSVFLTLVDCEWSIIMHSFMVNRFGPSLVFVSVSFFGAVACLCWNKQSSITKLHHQKRKTQLMILNIPRSTVRHNNTVRNNSKNKHRNTEKFYEKKKKNICFVRAISEKIQMGGRMDLK